MKQDVAVAQMLAANAALDDDAHSPLDRFDDELALTFDKLQTEEGRKALESEAEMQQRLQKREDTAHHIEVADKRVQDMVLRLLKLVEWREGLRFDIHAPPKQELELMRAACQAFLALSALTETA